MANIKDLKQRIDSITNTRQITNAMKMVAAAKRRKAQGNAVSLRPYANEIDKMIQVFRAKQAINDHPYLKPKASKKRTLLIVIAGDKGLCGSFNSQVLKEAIHFLESNADTDIISIGKKSNDFFKKHSYTVLSKYVGISEHLDNKIIKEIVYSLEDSYLEKDYKRVVVLYNAFKNALESEVILKQILPIMATEEVKANTSSVEFICEPDEESVLDELVSKYTFTELKRALAESFAAENSARMNAMDNATENANDLIADLSLEYNRERQSSITNEIIEVSSGAEAINK